MEELVFTPEGFRTIFPEGDRNADLLSQAIDESAIDSAIAEVTVVAPSPVTEVEPENLEILAEKVYELIRRRLEIERERYGGSRLLR